MEIRRRNVKTVSPERPVKDVLQTLDIFPKLPKDCTRSTPTGGADTSLDLLDVTGSDLDSMGKVRYRKATFELTGSTRKAFERRQEIANLLRSQHTSVPEMLWKRDDWSISNNFATDWGYKSGRPTRYDACNIVGTYFVRKVAGNMHIVPGKPIKGPGMAHIHMASVLDLPAMETYRYYLSIVPTRVMYTFSSSNTYQYAVTMNNRTINHGQGNHGIPGIFITYDTFPLLVQVTESRELFGTCLARLAALVGGLFATTGFLRQLTCGLPDLVKQTRLGRRLSKKWTVTSPDGQTNHSNAPVNLLNPESAT